MRIDDADSSDGTRGGRIVARDPNWAGAVMLLQAPIAGGPMTVEERRTTLSPLPYCSSVDT